MLIIFNSNKINLSSQLQDLTGAMGWGLLRIRRKVFTMSKILIVEDNQVLVKMYKIKLDLEGFQVETASEGQEGLEKLNDFSPDLILLDLAMPGMDGFEFLEELRKNEKLKEITVIIFSNLGQESDIKRAKELGAKDYLIKVNLTPRQVVEKIRQYL